MLAPRSASPHFARRTALVAVLLVVATAATAPTTPAQSILRHPYSNAAGDLAGDVDGDGLVDLVEVVNGLRVWHGQGDGTFAGSTISPAPGIGFPVALGDVDGDGRDDVAFRRSLPGQPLVVGVALATGAWAFGPASLVELPGVNTLVQALSLFDVDGDGDLDLLVGRGGEARLIGLLNDGTGAFSGGADLLGVNGIRQITSGDVNGDGVPDLVLRGEQVVAGASLVAVLFGEGGGAYSAPVLAPGPALVGTLAAADLTGDGRDDLVLADAIAGTPLVLVSWAPHTAGFGAPVPILQVADERRILALRAADLDDDGRADLVVADDDGVVTVLRQEPGGTLAPPVLHGAWPAVADLLLDDVDRNGSRDVLALGHGPSTHLPGSGGGGFGPALGLPATARDVTAADVDGDGRDELVSLGEDGGPLRVHGEDALGGWALQAEVDAGPAGLRVVAGRLTPDAQPDLLVVRGGAGTSALVLVPGAAGGAFDAPLVTPLPFQAMDGWAEDVDGDGLLDALVAGLGGQTVHVLRNDGLGAFHVTDALGPFQFLRGVAADDMDGDGTTDVVVGTAQGNGRVSVHLGHGDGTFAPPIVTDMTAPASWPENLALGDIDGDGAVDVAFYEGFLQTLVLPGLGDGAFGAPVGSTSEIFDELLLVDLDRDGLLDLVGGRTGSPAFVLGSVFVRRGTGTLAFGPLEEFPTPHGVDRLAVADTDGDGALDVVAAVGGPQLVVLHNAEGPWEELGHSLAGSNGHSRLSGSGTLAPGSAVELRVTHGPTLAPTTLVLGLGELLAPFKGGVLVPTADVLVSGLLTDAVGGLSLAGHWPADASPGTQLVMQAWSLDVRAGGAASSTGLRATTP